MAKKSSEIALPGIKAFNKSGSPLYQQVYEQFREMILSKRLRPGDRLPATRTLSKSLKVSRTIITQSFEQLILEGYLVGKIGSGTFVADVVPDYLTLARKAATVSPEENVNVFKLADHHLPTEILFRNSSQEKLIPFQTGCPSFDYFPYKIWQQVGNKVLKNFKSFHLGYDDALGYWPLRKEIAKYLRVARAVDCEPEQVIVVTGSQQGLNLITECLLKTGDKVWMEDPGYHGAKFSFLKKGIIICPIPIEKDGLDIDFAIQQCKDAKLVYVTPSHQFPLGGTLSLSKRLQLTDWAKHNKMWILEDDYDSEYRYEGRPLASLQGLNKEIVIYSGTFSKVLYPGLRLAYIVLPNLLMVNEVKKIKAMMDRQSPILDQLILSKFMSEGHFLRHLRKMRVLYAERQQVFLKLAKLYLNDYIEFKPSPAGMNLTGIISEKVHVQKFKSEVKKQELIVPFIKDYSIEGYNNNAITLGYTAFSKYKIKTGLEKLLVCLNKAII